MTPADHTIHVFMIAIGKPYKEIAALTRPRAEQVLQLPITTITSGNDPYLLKLQLLDNIPDDHLVLFLDVDLVLFDWDWSPFLPTHFNAVPHQPDIHWSGAQPIRTLIHHDEPFNTGLWLCPARLRNYFALARGYLKKELCNFKFLMGDETALNYALRKHNAPVNTLPGRFNWQTLHDADLRPKSTLGLHLLNGTPANKLDRIRIALGTAMKRDDLLFDWLKQLPTERTWRWLDIGAHTGNVSRKIAKLFSQNYYDMIDVKPCHQDVKLFDGKHVPFNDRVYDFVLLNFVLHHAADNLEMLILEAARVTNSVILIQEDIPDGTEETAALLRRHDPKARYFDIAQWAVLFKQLLPNCTIQTQLHPEPAVDCLNYHVPRAFFVVYPGASS